MLDNKKFESMELADGLLESVAGGKKVDKAEDIEMGSKELKPGIKDMPFMCKNDKCSSVFYLSDKGTNKVMCPHCKTVYFIAG